MPTAPSSYTDSFLRDRVKSGPDKGRAAYATGLAERARAGDQAALSELAWRSGVAPDPNPNDKEGAWATADAKNFGQMLLRDASPGYTPQYQAAHDGGGFLSGVGHAIGGVLKTAAPFAGFIPGIGPLAAAGLGAGASALGGGLRGEPFKLDKTIMAGVAGGAGNYLLGGQGPAGLKGIPARLGIGGGGPPGGMPGGTPGGAPGGALPEWGASGGGGPGGGPGGLLGSIGKYAPLIAGGLGMVGNYQDQSKANDLRERGIASAESQYAAREPFRMKALAAASAAPPTRPDLSWIFNDPGNPYNRSQPRAG